MESLNKPCQNCHKPMNGGVYRSAHTCPHCLFQHETSNAKRGRKQRKPAPVAALPEKEALQEAAEQTTTPEQPTAAPAQVSTPVLSSKSADEHDIVEVLREIAAECALKIKLTPDLISNGKFVGSKSEKVKAALDQGKKHTLAQLRQEAQHLGANIVTGVTLKNAFKKADPQNLSITVRATGVASLAELTQEVSGA